MTDGITTPPPPPPTEMVQAEDFNAQVQSQQTQQPNTTNTANTNAASQIPPEQLVQFAMQAGQQMMQAAHYTGNQNLAMQAQNLMKTAQGVIDTQGNPYLLQQLYGLAQGGGSTGGGLGSDDPMVKQFRNWRLNALPKLMAGISRTTPTTTTTTPTTTTPTTTPATTTPTTAPPMAAADLVATSSYNLAGTGAVQMYKAKTGDDVYVRAPASITAAAMPKTIDYNMDGLDDTPLLVGAEVYIKLATPNPKMTDGFGTGTFVGLKPLNFNKAEGDEPRALQIMPDGTNRICIYTGYDVTAKTGESQEQAGLRKAIEAIKADPAKKDTKFKIGTDWCQLISYENSPADDKNPSIFVKLVIVGAATT